MQKIYLKEMLEKEFESFQKQSLEAYSADLSIEAKISINEAQAAAEKQFEQLLPDKIKTPGHFFYKIYDYEKPVGHLWFSIRKNYGKERIFICDIFVQESHRGQGFGSFALNWLDSKAQELGYLEIGLHAFAHNSKAQALYSQLGYKLTSVYMMKDLSGIANNQLIKT